MACSLNMVSTSLTEKLKKVLNHIIRDSISSFTKNKVLMEITGIAYISNVNELCKLFVSL